jgi:hypothetical protein
VLIPGFSENSFLEMGKKNFLTGEALNDYRKLVLQALNEMEESI